MAWAIGLGVATVRLAAWQKELSQVLVQLRSDALLRASAIRDHERVNPEWYRRRALALLPAVERLRNDAIWTLVMPGSWRIFDDLEERAEQRIDEAFGQVVVETIRREIANRASALAGASAGAAVLPPEPGACPAVQTGASAAVVSLTPDQLPEFAAARRWLADAEQLDRAAAALQSLGTATAAQPEQLRLLVRYALGEDLSGSAARSLALFRTSAAPQARPTLELGGHLRWAMRCGALRHMGSLHQRLLAHNALLELEESLRGARLSALFEPDPNGAFASSLARLHAVKALLDEQQGLLARGRHEWMHAPNGSGDGLGPEHAQIMARLRNLRLLDASAVAEIDAQLRTEQEQFRRRRDAAFARAGSGVVWQPTVSRYALSPERTALRLGLAALLREPFMADDTQGAAMQAASSRVDPPSDLQDVLALVDQRRAFMRDALLRFPPNWRPAVSRFVDERLAQVAAERAMAYAAAAPLQGPLVSWSPFGSPDTAQGRLEAVEVALRDAAPALANRVRARLMRELPSQPPGGAPLQPLPLFDPRSGSPTG